MVNKGNTFSHITVSTDDEDDVVIQAGIREEPVSADVSSDQETCAPGQNEPAPSVGSGSVADDDSTEEATPASHTREESYHETRLEDLKDIPMPVIQKVIILIAVVSIIGVVVYYNFMR